MLQEFLDAKPLYYDEIDYTRMPRVYERIKKHFNLKNVIHLIGTNGKGTTGRFLASALYSIGYKTAHYTSPHILKFNERIWLDGQNVDDKVLESAHIELLSILDKEDSEALSYFEYTTLLAMIVFKGCDYIVLEAGLGGENDATAVFDKALTLVTPIDFDHEAFLGSDIKEIALTKLNAVQNTAIISEQKYDEVMNVAHTLEERKGVKFYEVDQFLDSDDRDKIKIISEKLSLESYLSSNLSQAVSALKFLNIDYSADDFNGARFFGRLSKVSDNVIVDVGHNPLAASAILDALSPNKYILVYNSYQDKNYKKILEILKPIIKHVEIIDIDNQRAESQKLMQKVLDDLGIEYKIFDRILKTEEYLVFGSFSVVETFMKGYDG